MSNSDTSELTDTRDERRHAPWWRSVTAVSIIALLTGQLAAPLAQAQQASPRVITDPNAPIQFRPNIGSSANGTPQIDITAPSSGGISHNRFRQYDVDIRGVILNNATSGGTSVIGGTVNANPNLIGSGPAAIILNEVTGSTASSLAGPTEVFGRRANVIIANPNGVGCAGCTFINTGTVTLSAAVPLPNYATGAVSYDLSRGGQVSITGTGMSAAPGHTLSGVGLVGRQIVLDAPVATEGLARLVAGSGVFNSATGEYSLAGAAVTGLSGPAIRSTTAGTLRAGTVTALSHDLDLGVEMLGSITALSGQATIRSAGALVVGAIEGYHDVALQASGSVEVRGNQQTFGSYSIQGLDVWLVPDVAVMAAAGIAIDASGRIESGALFNTSGAIRIVSSGDILLRDSALLSPNAVKVQAGGNLITSNLGIYGASIDASAGGLMQLDRTLLDSGSTLAIVGRDVTLGTDTAWRAPGAIAITASNTFTNATFLDLASPTNLTVAFGASLVNATTGTILDGRFDRTFAGDLINSGVLYATESLNATANVFENTQTGVIYSPSITLAIATTGTNAGDILADAAFAVGARTFTNSGRLASNNTLDLSIIDRLENAGRVESAYQITATAASIVNTAAGILTAPGVALRGGALSNTGAIGPSAGQGVVDVAMSGEVVNAGLLGGGDVAVIAAASFVNTATGVVGAIQIGVGTTGRISNEGRLIATDYAQLKASGIANRGDGRIGAATVVLQATGGIENLDRAEIVASSGLGLQAGSLTNQGRMSSDGQMAIAGVSPSAPLISLSNSGAIVAADILTVTAGEVLNAASGAIEGRDVGIETGRLGNDGNIGATGILQLAVAGAASNTGALHAGEAVALAAVEMSNAATGVVAARGVWLDTSGSTTNSGQVTAVETAQIRAGAVANTGAAARITGSTVLISAIGALANVAGGTIAATSQLSLAVASLSNTGALTSGWLLVAESSGAIANAGAVTAVGNIALTGLTIDSAAGATISGADIVLESLLSNAAQAGISNAGTIVGRGFIEVAAASVLITNQGAVYAEKELFVTGHGFVNAAGGSLRAPSVWIDAATSVSNAGSIVAAQNDGSTAAANVLRIEARDIVNQGGSGSTSLLSGGTTILIAANALTNASNAHIIGTRTLDIQARSTSGNRALLSSGTTSTGLLTHGGNLYIAIADEGFDLPSTLSVGGTLALSMAGDVVNNGTVSAGGDLFLESTSGSIINGTAASGDRQITAGGNLVLNAAANIDNYSSVLRSYGSMELIAGGAINNIRIGSGTTYHVNGGVIVAGGVLTTRAASLRNVGSTTSSGGNYQGSGGSFSNELITYSIETSVPVYAKICTKRRFEFCTRHDVVIVDYQTVIDHYEIASAVSVGGSPTLMLSGAFTNSGAIQASSIDISAASIVNVAATTRSATVVTQDSKVISLVGLTGVTTSPGVSTSGAQPQPGTGGLIGQGVVSAPPPRSGMAASPRHKLRQRPRPGRRSTASPISTRARSRRRRSRWSRRSRSSSRSAARKFPPSAASRSCSIQCSSSRLWRRPS